MPQPTPARDAGSADLEPAGRRIESAAKIRAQSLVLAVVLLAIVVVVSAVPGWLGGLVAWLIVLAALAVFALCLRARP